MANLINRARPLIIIVNYCFRPKNLDQWVDEDFEPVPIQLTVEPLVNLLTPRNFEASEEYSVPPGINITYVINLFNAMNENFCSDIMGLSPENCTTEEKGVKFKEIR